MGCDREQKNMSEFQPEIVHRNIQPKDEKGIGNCNFCSITQSNGPKKSYTKLPWRKTIMEYKNKHYLAHKLKLNGREKAKGGISFFRIPPLFV